jgi:TatD DNase family protein
MIDSHIHLDQYDLKTLSQTIEKWKEAGIRHVIAVSNNLASSYKTLELQSRYSDFVFACVGFHPEFPLPNSQDVEEWKSLIRQERKRIIGIGEIGLPHYSLDHLPNSLEEYVESLKHFIEVAKSHQLPVVLHAVHNKTEIVLKILQKAKITHAHFHWLKAPDRLIAEIIKAGYYISVTPEICYRGRDQKLASNIPLSQLLIETDGPWQYENQFQQQQTTPLLLNNIVDQLVKIKTETHDDIKNQTILNTQRCYELPY